MEKDIKEGSGKKSITTVMLVVTIAIAVLGGGFYAVHIILSGQHYINTGNARVTTNLITVSSVAPGILERFNVYDGMHVEKGQILGWIQQGETFRSPVDGIVISINAVVGQYILPAQPLATIADIGNIHIQANIYETDIQNIRLGQPAAITLDGISNQTFGGHVRHISRITEVELAGFPTMINTGTFRRITHTVPIEIVITDGVDLSYFLGTNARVSLPVLVGEEEFPINTGIENIVTVIGRVESADHRNIYASHISRIENVLVGLGDFVEEGQILATLDAADLETAIAVQRSTINQTALHSQLQAYEAGRMLYTATRNIDSETNIHMINAGSNLTLSLLQMENAQRMYNQARLDYENLESLQIVAADSILRAVQLEMDIVLADYANMTTLYRVGALSQQEIRDMRDAITITQNRLDNATTDFQNALETERRHLEQLGISLDSTRAAYEAATEMKRYVEMASNQEIERLQTALQMSQIDTTEHMHHLLEQMERQLNEGVIISPISGTITAVHAYEGEFSAARLFTIENLQNLRVFANIREYDLPNIYVGKPVTITAYATGDMIHTGVITSISPRAVTTFPTVEFEIEVQITSGYYLRPGMSARVRM